ncbi:MAG: proline--tRNA ligase [Negativicutes bacterium]
MKMSNLYAPTLREVPAEAEVVSHQLMLRAGMIRKAAGGVYSYLPLAWRTLRKIEQIVREEMDAKGGQEIAMPIVQPAEIWQQTGRWDVYGDEMFRLKDRHQRDFCLGPTHEEMVTTLVKSDVRSYRQLPLLVYQIQNKYRDEIRPRFGLMRGREFIMKDLYSFDRDTNGLDISYKKMYDAYIRIFTRCGLTFRPVEADPGAIGGSGTHEFMVLADSGEAAIAYCDSCDYAANVEKAELAPIASTGESSLPLDTKATPKQRTIQEVAQFLSIHPEHLIKSLAYMTENGPVLALVRGDHEVNEIKLINLLNVLQLELATEADIRTAFHSVPGYIGPLGLSGVTIVADASVMNLMNAACGANVEDQHHVNVNPGRDFKADKIADIRMIKESDPCPRCGAKVKTARGIEVGQVFKLHTKYSKALEASYLDENGQENLMVMGCYGVGVSRTMAAAIEQHHDDDGIIWPVAIAPYQVVIVPINIKDESQMTLCEKLYEDLKSAGVEVVFDDRDERSGVKFKDADLIGYPVRITIGPKALKENSVEVKVRRTKESTLYPLGEHIESIRQLLATL